MPQPLFHQQFWPLLRRTRSKTIHQKSRGMLSSGVKRGRFWTNLHLNSSLTARRWPKADAKVLGSLRARRLHWRDFPPPAHTLYALARRHLIFTLRRRCPSIDIHIMANSIAKLTVSYVIFCVSLINMSVLACEVGDLGSSKIERRQYAIYDINIMPLK